MIPRYHQGTKVKLGFKSYFYRSAKRACLPKPPAGMDRVEHDGRSLLRSTAQETLLEQFDAIDRRVERLWARIDAESRSGEVPFDAVDFDPPGRGANPERWLQNPAHLLGLHAVMGKLLEEQYVTCADVRHVLRL